MTLLVDETFESTALADLGTYFIATGGGTTYPAASTLAEYSANAYAGDKALRWKARGGGPYSWCYSGVNISLGSTYRSVYARFRVCLEEWHSSWSTRGGLLWFTYGYTIFIVGHPGAANSYKPCLLTGGGGAVDGSDALSLDTWYQMDFSVVELTPTSARASLSIDGGAIITLNANVASDASIANVTPGYVAGEFGGNHIKRFDNLQVSDVPFEAAPAPSLAFKLAIS